MRLPKLNVEDIVVVSFICGVVCGLTFGVILMIGV